MGEARGDDTGDHTAREGENGGVPRSLVTKASPPRALPTSTMLPGWKGKAGSRCSAPQAPPSLLLHTMVLASPWALKRGLKCRHRLLLSLPRFSTKLE
jgi:hypothetical protein